MEEDFINLVENNQGLIHKICRLYGDNEEDRNDLFQEILLQLWKAYPGYSGKAKISTWMYRIALYTAMGDLKKRKRRIQHLKVKNTELNSADLNFDLEHVQAGISLLNAGDKALLALYIDDKPYQEIAEIIGITENNVGVRLNRIKKKLRESLKV
ncbi:MAG: sigma-70 family RNA polymerase sigma factor [Bacteroidota bacterium]